MRKCVNCGKSGLFLKLDKIGLCAECARARESGIAAAREYLAPISAAFDDIKQSGASLIMSSSWIGVKDVPTRGEAERLRGVCSDLCDMLARWSEYPYLLEAILDESVPNKPSSSIVEHPSIPLGVVSDRLRLDSAFPSLEKKVKDLNTCLLLYGKKEYFCGRKN